MIYDISPLIHKDLPVWPGDASFSRTLTADMKRGSMYTSSTISATCHLGSHVDAPSHYSLKGESIDQRPLDCFLGKCQVMHVEVPKKSRIHISHLKSVHAPRILFATKTFDYAKSSFQQDFAALDPALIEHLAALGILTIGIDTPSVDLFESTQLDAHIMASRYNINLLEGVVLQDVPEGIYELIALPLKLKDCDASPVRAILRTI